MHPHTLHSCVPGCLFPDKHVRASICRMQGSQSRSASLKQAEEEGLLKAGEAGSSTFLPLETDLTSQQRSAFRYDARDKQHVTAAAPMFLNASRCNGHGQLQAYECIQWTMLMMSS